MAIADSAAAEIPIRDIQMSAVPHWWPPAPGWWVLAAMVVLLSIALLVRWARHRRRQQDYQRLRSELDLIEQRFETSQDRACYLRDLSRLLRRICRYRSAQPERASAHGDGWAEFLADGHALDSDMGRAAAVFASDVYMAEPKFDDPIILSDLVDYWLRRVSLKQSVSDMALSNGPSGADA